MTLDLSRVAGTYDVAVASGNIIVTGVSISCTVVGATFTYCSIQTDDAVPRVLMTATEGLVINLVAGSDPVSASQLWLSPWLLQSGKKIQYTLNGLTGTGELKFLALWRPVAPGAALV